MESAEPGEESTGGEQQLGFNEDGQLWAASRRELEEKLSEYYGVDIWLQGDHVQDDELLYEVMLYSDGENQHLVDDGVTVFGHSPSGAVGVNRDDLPSKDTVDTVVEEA